jgi:CHASE2 domain-containing sensor protein
VLAIQAIFTVIQGPLTTSAGKRRHSDSAMTRKDLLLLWSPRILGIAVGLFLSLFAFDAFERGKPVASVLTDFAIHLVPAAVILAIVALSWRRPWIGGVTFVLLGAAYGPAVNFRLDWTLPISGPLLTAGVLFLWSWRRHEPTNAS